MIETWMKIYLVSDNTRNIAYPQHPNLFLQGTTNNGRFSFSVGMDGLQLHWNEYLVLDTLYTDAYTKCQQPYESK